MNQQKPLYKRIAHKLLYPGIAVVLISIPIAAALLIYVFMSGSDNTPLAYVSYFISAYSLTIACVQIPRIVRSTKRLLHRSKYIDRYLTDTKFKIYISLHLSLAINLLYAAMKLFSGIYYRSVWFGTLSVYYILLAVMRYLLLNHAHRNPIGSELIAELRRYRMCGIMLIFMNIALSGVVVLIMHQNEGFRYAGVLIYTMAAYTFYTMTTAIIGVVKYRKYNSPLMSAAKAINLVAAIVSMLSLETAMLAEFGNGDDKFKHITLNITGAAVCVLVLAIAVYMVVNSTIKINKHIK